MVQRIEHEDPVPEDVIRRVQLGHFHSTAQLLGREAQGQKWGLLKSTTAQVGWRAGHATTPEVEQLHFGKLGRAALPSMATSSTTAAGTSSTTAAGNPARKKKKKRKRLSSKTTTDGWGEGQKTPSSSSSWEEGGRPKLRRLAKNISEISCDEHGIPLVLSRKKTTTKDTEDSPGTQLTSLFLTGSEILTTPETTPEKSRATKIDDETKKRLTTMAHCYGAYEIAKAVKKKPAARGKSKPTAVRKGAVENMESESFGLMRLGMYKHASYIQCKEESGKWGCICHFSKTMAMRNGFHHHTIALQVFRKVKMLGAIRKIGKRGNCDQLEN